MLSRRLLSAAVLLSVSLGLLWLDLKDTVRGQSGLWTVPMLLFFSLGTVWEFAALLQRKWPVDPRMVTWHALLALLVTLFPIWYSMLTQKDYPVDCPVGRMGWVLVGVMTGVGLSGLHALSIFGRKFDSEEAVNRHRENVALGWMLSATVICYVVGGLSLWHVIRMRDPSRGLYELFALLAVTKFADTGAYLVGKMMGRIKLIPAVSPGKTVEGFLGGMAFSVLVSYVAFRGVLPMFDVRPGPHIWGPALIGVLLTIVGLVGDLLESMVKRSVGAKDSGQLLPGLGGVWDVTDSVLPASIVGYLCLMANL